MTGLGQVEARADESVSAGDGAPEPAFNHVLVGVDGTSTGLDAIALGGLLRHPGGRSTLAHVVLSQALSYRNFHSTPVWKESRDMLERERAAAGVAAELTGVFSASVGAGLHQLAEDRRADLLVVGSSTRGPGARLLRGDDTRGSLSSATLRGGRRPVRLRRASDGNPNDRGRVQRYARSRGRARGGPRSCRALSRGDSGADGDQPGFGRRRCPRTDHH
jgi:nucleotide-binding universal stress UspA family protein